jgi:hypothetical protein
VNQFINMKKTIVIILVIKASLSSFSQLLPETGTKWIYESKYSIGSKILDTTNVVVEVKKDTLIQGMNTKFITYSNRFCQNDSSYYFFEQDNIIYQRVNNSMQPNNFDFKDFVFLDFGADAGSQWIFGDTASPYTTQYKLFQLDSISTYSIGDFQLKRLHTTIFTYQKKYQTKEYFLAYSNCQIFSQRLIECEFYRPFQDDRDLTDCFGEFLPVKLLSFQDSQINLSNIDVSYNCEENPLSIGKNKNSLDINLSPNPSISFVHLHGIEIYNLTSFQVISLLGNEENVELSGNTLNINPLKAGIYLLNLYNEQGLVKTLKFVKE